MTHYFKMNGIYDVSKIGEEGKRLEGLLHDALFHAEPHVRQDAIASLRAAYPRMIGGLAVDDKLMIAQEGPRKKLSLGYIGYVKDSYRMLLSHPFLVRENGNNHP